MVIGGANYATNFVLDGSRWVFIDMLRGFIRIISAGIAVVALFFFGLTGMVAYYLVNGPFTAADEAGGRTLPRALPMSLARVTRTRDEFVVDGRRFKVPRSLQRGSSASANSILFELPMLRELTGETRPDSKLHLAEKYILVYVDTREMAAPSRVEEVERLLNAYGQKLPSCSNQRDGKIIEAIEVDRPDYDKDTYYVMCRDGIGYSFISCDKESEKIRRSCRMDGMYGGKIHFGTTISYSYLNGFYNIHGYIIDTLRGFEVVGDPPGSLKRDEAGGHDGQP